MLGRITSSMCLPFYNTKDMRLFSCNDGPGATLILMLGVGTTPTQRYQIMRGTATLLNCRSSFCRALTMHAPTTALCNHYIYNSQLNTTSKHWLSEDTLGNVVNLRYHSSLIGVTTWPDFTGLSNLKIATVLYGSRPRLSPWLCGTFLLKTKQCES